jgi:hypothetical protein
MNYVSTTFKEFIRNRLNEEVKKPMPEQPINEAKPYDRAWIYEMQEKFNEICKDYDDLYK